MCGSTLRPSRPWRFSGLYRLKNRGVNRQGRKGRQVKPEHEGIEEALAIAMLERLARGQSIVAHAWFYLASRRFRVLYRALCVKSYG